MKIMKRAFIGFFESTRAQNTVLLGIFQEGKLETHGSYACPKCESQNGVEIVYVQPVDERNQRKDRRQRIEPSNRFNGVDKRKLIDRRSAVVASAKDQEEAKPNTTCLECGHEWHAA